ncbi:MAG: hypothetical protein J7604_18060 [Sporocytophaga sp.]|uniref:hypothetical protein n=1 Tax=Sporocytophaga sp. TaxID=2231183 RepID=UPI001B2CB24B|nr:hypothetical protein [Sporocytophaga sp.]MBO9702119.1 hypothetical protein [Sporocytophaga sp.]
MDFLLIFAILVVLVLIFWQDLRERAVSWYFFPLLFVLVFLYRIKSAGVESLVENIGINSLFLLVQLVMVSLYFSLKNREWVNITKEYLGIGDVLFLFVITPLFTPVLYVMFYLISLFLIVVVAMLVKVIKNYQKTIPLAGLQALLLSGLLLTDIYVIKFDDQYILNYLFI